MCQAVFKVFCLILIHLTFSTTQSIIITGTMENWARERLKILALLSLSLFKQGFESIQSITMLHKLFLPISCSSFSHSSYDLILYPFHPFLCFTLQLVNAAFNNHCQRLRSLGSRLWHRVHSMQDVHEWAPMMSTPEEGEKDRQWGKTDLRHSLSRYLRIFTGYSENINYFQWNAYKIG